MTLNSLHSNNEVLYQFNGTIRDILNDGERATLSVLMNQPSTITFYSGEVHIIAEHPELGGDRMYYPIIQTEIIKKVHDRRFLFWKYQDVQIILSLGVGSVTEYTISVINEAVADDLIDWYESYKTKVKNLLAENGYIL